MYVTEKAPGEVGQITKLSQAIRVGSAYIPENKWWNGCPLGTAAQVLGLKVPPWGIPSNGASTMRPVFEVLQERFGLPPSKLMQISNRHCREGVPREQICAELEAEGL